MGPAAEGWMVGQAVVGQKRAAALSNRPENRGLIGDCSPRTVATDSPCGVSLFTQREDLGNRVSGSNHCPRRRQRPSRPPQMQRTRMPVPNRLLPCRGCVDRVERQGDFNELFAGRLHAPSAFVKRSPHLITVIPFRCPRNCNLLSRSLLRSFRWIFLP